ncbi:Disulfide-bond oxidoreductase YfcG [BD1-7 clade bacterium]|uniref:Disulfide-bond oxidoreductase YfcG n=1 Tax=BD1-7 clade bacterium TaxID=2029982 RepID=A0A5S9PSG9_9GAMM|nr:Disulfide-bond oxidoreductase YfcG [BD1-7 clade bacterium]
MDCDYRIYGDIKSGNCYKIQLLMSLLDIPHDWVHIDILAHQTHTSSFRAMNKNAKIPVLEIDGDTYLCESNAILNFLAEGSSYMPSSGLARARVLQWQFFEQYSHEPYIAVARFINKYLGLPEDRHDEYLSKQGGGHKALNVMDGQLSETPFFVGEQPTLADISLYAYTHVADEGGFDLGGYPHIDQWLARIESLPGYVSMP